ncbi:MAG: hypothetical protein RIE52_12135 [Balneola sp.]
MRKEKMYEAGKHFYNIAINHILSNCERMVKEEEELWDGAELDVEWFAEKFSASDEEFISHIGQMTFQMVLAISSDLEADRLQYLIDIKDEEINNKQQKSEWISQRGVKA